MTIMDINHTTTKKQMIKMNLTKKISTFFLFVFLTGCSVAPGMYMNTSSWLSSEQVIIDEYRKDIKIIDSELIQSLDGLYSESISLDLLSAKPEDYKIGIGDVISIVVFDQPDLLPTYGNAFRNPLIERQVGDDGTIFYPYAGVISVEGLSREEVREKVTLLLSDVFNEPQVDVSIINYNSKKVILSGAFSKQGPIYLTSVPLSLSEVVSMGQPIRNQADLTGLKLTRNNKKYLINFEYFSRESSDLQNIYIQKNDVIHIPFRDDKKIHIVGEARSPRSIDLYRKTMSLSDALSRAGGVSSITGDGNLVYIIRPNNDLNDAEIFRANLNSPAGMIVASNFQLQSQDIVFVGPADIARWNRVIAQLFPFASFLNAVDSLSNSDSN